MKLEKSTDLFNKGQKNLVGAVNSPVRAFKSVGGVPVFIDHAKGTKIFDVDDNENDFENSGVEMEGVPISDYGVQCDEDVQVNAENVSSRRVRRRSAYRNDYV